MTEYFTGKTISIKNPSSESDPPYIAGELTVVGLEDLTDAWDYQKAVANLEIEENESLPVKQREVLAENFNSRFRLFWLPILVSDASGVFGDIEVVKQLQKTNRQFFDKCLIAAYKLNPDINRAYFDRAIKPKLEEAGEADFLEVTATATVA